MNAPRRAPGGGFLHFNPIDRMALYKSYMPFVKGGGLFVNTSHRYELGNEVFVMLKLPQEAETDRMSIVGKVVWISRNGGANKPAGIGIQMADMPDNAIVRDRIERAIAGISADTLTYTM
jgi:type IV pilus assembly protein PilZ